VKRVLKDIQSSGALVDVTVDRDLIHWIDNLDERTQQEVAFAVDYAQHFGHGTAGHLAYTTIYRMAVMLEQYRQEALEAQGR